MIAPAFQDLAQKEHTMRSTWMIAAIIALSTAHEASAHARLKSAVPNPGSMVSATPKELDLTFSERLNLKFSEVVIVGSDGVAVKTGKGMLMDDDTTLMVPLPNKLPAGTYTVEWHVLSADGHTIRGKYSFTVTP